MKTNITKIMLGASALVIMAAAPAVAETTTKENPAHVQAQHQAGTAEVKTNPRGPEVTKQDIKEGWKDTKEAVSDKYEDVKAVVLGKDQKGDKFERTTYSGSYTAKGLIGHKVKDSAGEDVATIHDIILDKSGRADAVILSDGGFFGIGGKKVALDYKNVIKSTTSSEILLPISKEQVKNVAEFSYEKMGADKGVRMMPSDGVSILDVLGSNIVDPSSNKVASVDNVIMSGGRVSKLIVGFDKTLGLGGEQAALDFNDAKLVRNDSGKLDFKLSANQTASFEGYKKSVTKSTN